MKLIVFDWDGTVVDSEVRIVQAMQLGIADLGLAPRSHDEVKQIIGLGMKEALMQLYPDADDAFCAQLTNTYRTYFLAPEQRSAMFPGVKGVIENLAQQDYFLAVATGKSRRGLDRELLETQLQPLFHKTICADEAPSKPNPQMLNELMDFVGVEPGETLMIGDTTYDLQMASNAGVASVGVRYGVHSVERLAKHGPVAILNDLSELAALLDSLK